MEFLTPVVTMFGKGIYFPVDANNVYMQYTGINDKNGREIYEGDCVRFILSCSYLTEGIVEWSQEGACWKVKSRLPLHMHQCVDIEVIGNIFENQNKI